MHDDRQAPASGGAGESAVLERGLPASPDAERSILGAILLDDKHYAEAASQIEPYHFALDGHRRIFRAFERLHGKQSAIDIITVIEELSLKKEVEAVGGVAYLASLTEGLPRRISITEYIDIVKQKSALRDIIRAAYATLDQAADQTDEPAQIMAELQARMREIASDHDSAVVVESTRAFFIRRYGNVDAFLKPPERAAGILTPWKQYNELTDGGIKRQELTIAAARPSMGKTAWAMNVAVYAAVKLGMKVLFFSAEQSKEQIFDRAVCSIARVTMRELRDTQARFTQTSYVNDAIQDLVSSFLWFDDTGDLTVDQIDARAELKSRTDGLDLMVTDFLQYLDPGRFARKNDTRSIQIGNMTKSLRNTGKRLHVGNLVLAQTGRKDSSSAPSLSDLRESGDIEQNADQVTFLHRPEYYDKVDPDKKGVAEFIIAKQRNGPTDTARTQFMGKYFSFVDQQ